MFRVTKHQICIWLTLIIGIGPSVHANTVTLQCHNGLYISQWGILIQINSKFSFNLLSTFCAVHCRTRNSCFEIEMKFLILCALTVLAVLIVQVILPADSMSCQQLKSTSYMRRVLYQFDFIFYLLRNHLLKPTEVDQAECQMYSSKI